MGIVCMLIIALLYLITALDTWLHGDRPMAGVLLCYSVANLLLIIVAYREQ